VIRAGVILLTKGRLAVIIESPLVSLLRHASVILSALAAKQLGLLHELNSGVTSIALLVNPDNPTTETYVNDAQAASRTFGQQIHVLRASTADEIDAAFATLPQLHAEALIVGPDGLLISRRDRIVAQAARQNLPTLSGTRDFTAAGGLMSYGRRGEGAPRGRSLFRGDLRVSRQARRSREADRVGRDRALPVRQAARAGNIPLAADRGWHDAPDAVAALGFDRGSRLDASALVGKNDSDVPRVCARGCCATSCLVPFTHSGYCEPRFTFPTRQ
jgi:hypothetical protein